jgi:16S rRNA processing protein RimM
VGSSPICDGGENLRLIEVGKVIGAFGVKGWIKVHSYTASPGSILKYLPWTLEVKGSKNPVELVEGLLQSSAVVAKVKGYDDRNQAESLKNSKIFVPRSVLPTLIDGSFYWDDLIGLSVSTCGGHSLGRVSRVMETGANDVLVVIGDRERLIPFVSDVYVKHVDLEAGCITVDWDPDF